MIVHHLSPRDIDCIRSLGATHTAREISEIIGRSDDAVRAAAKRNGIALVPGSARKGYMTAADQQVAIALCPTTLAADIAIRLGRTRDAIVRSLERAGMWQKSLDWTRLEETRRRYAAEVEARKPSAPGTVRTSVSGITAIVNPYGISVPYVPTLYAAGPV